MFRNYNYIIKLRSIMFVALISMNLVGFGITNIEKELNSGFLSENTVVIRVGESGVINDTAVSEGDDVSVYNTYYGENSTDKEIPA